MIRSHIGYMTRGTKKMHGPVNPGDWAQEHHVRNSRRGNRAGLVSLANRACLAIKTSLASSSSLANRPGLGFLGHVRENKMRVRAG